MDNKTTNLQLEKKLSPVNVWALALGCIIGWGAFVMPGNTFLINAGPLGTAIGMGTAALVMILISYNYQYMIRRYPLAGGEYTYTRAAFGSGHAYICAWFLGLSYATLVPMNATALALIGRNLLHNIFQFGFHYTVYGYDVYLGEVLLALGAILLFAGLSLRGVRFTGVFQVILVFSLVTGIAVIVAAAVLSPAATWANLKPGFFPGSETGKGAGIAAVMAVAPFAFVGFDTVPQSAEEYGFSEKKTRAIMLISILFGGCIYVALNTVTAAVVHAGFANWAEYIAAAQSLSGLESLPTFYAAYELLGNFGLFFIGIAVLGAILSGIVGFYMATSRLLFAMAREGALPRWFGELSKNHRVPKNAILFHMAISLFAPFLGRVVLGWLVDMSSLGAAIGYGYTSAAAFKYAKEEGNKGIMVTGVIGTIMAVVFAVILLIPIPGLHCSLGKQSYVCLLIWSVLGVLFVRKRRQEKDR